MKIKIKRFLAGLIAFVMLFTSSLVNIPLWNNSQVFASEIEEKNVNFTVNDAIKALIYYYDNEYYRKAESNQTLDGFNYVAMVKANVDLNKKNWKVEEKLEGNTLPGKAKQSLVLMELNKDPSNYENENLIETIVNELNTIESEKYIQNLFCEVFAVDKFNEQYPDKKIEYNVKKIVDLILKEKKENGCIGGSINNTAYAIEFFNKHQDIEGTKEAKEKAISYLKSQIKEKGAMYSKFYQTSIHCQAVRALLNAGEDVTSKEWSKDGYNIVDGIFKEWNGKNIIDKYGKNRHITHYTEALYALTTLKDLGYENTVLKDVNFENLNKQEEAEKTCNINMTVIYPSDDGKLEIKLKPSEFTVSSKKQLAGLTVLGAVQASGIDFTVNGTIINSIMGLKNEKQNGWMYTLNGEIPNTWAPDTSIKSGDKIVWYYSKNEDSEIPSYDEIVKLSKQPEDPKDESKPDGSRISEVINGVIEYYNEKLYVEEQGILKDYQYSTMYKAGADLNKKKWTLNEKYQTKYDMSWKMLPTKVHQSLILLDINKDPNNYGNRKFIDEIAKEIDEQDTYFAISELKAVLALEKYNSKFKDTRVEYNINKAIENVLKAQCDDGGFRQRQTSTLSNTGIALDVLSRHRDIKGVNEAIEKAIKYLKSNQKDDGAIYEKTFITSYYCDVLQGLIACKEDITSNKWTSTTGKNLVDGLFILWRDDNGFDNNKGESINNRGWLAGTQSALSSLIELKNSGYSEYIVKDIKVKKYGQIEETGNECKVNIAIALPENHKYVSYFKPKEVKINDVKHKGGFTALGALQAATSLYEINGDMVTAIFGHENKDNNGWMYTINGIAPGEMAGKVNIKEGDKVIWYYSIDGMNHKAPTWEELKGISQDKVHVENITLDKNKLTLNKGNEYKFKAIVTPENATNKNILWKSNNEKVIRIDNNGKILAIEKGSAIITATSEDGEKVASCEVTVNNNDSIEKDYKKVIDETITGLCNIVYDKEKIDAFEAVSLNAVNREVPEKYMENLIKEIETKDKSKFDENGKFKRFTDCSKAILGVVASGKDPRNVKGYNLIEDLCSKEMVNDTYARTYTLLALDSGNFKLPSGSKFSRKEIIEGLISNQKENATWNDWGNSFDVDTTAMVIPALAPYYKENSKVKEAIDKAIDGLSKTQNNEGELVSKWNKNGSSESTAQTIIALCSLGINPTTCNKFIKENRNLLDVLLDYKKKDGSFAHVKSDMEKFNDMATEQGFRAIAAYNTLINSKRSSIYIMKNFNEVEDKKNIEVKNLTTALEFKLGSEAKITVEAINKLKIDKEGTLIVALYNKENDKMINYVAVKSTIKNGESEKLEAMLKLPKQGIYEIKAFVWDNMKNMQSLSNEIIIPVK